LVIKFRKRDSCGGIKNTSAKNSNNTEGLSRQPCETFKLGVEGSEKGSSKDAKAVVPFQISVTPKRGRLDRRVNLSPGFVFLVFRRVL